ncbi:18221_t:CDS:1, partial [Gigaspora margarita]
KEIDQFEELNEKLNEIAIEQDEMFFMKELFNFAMFERDQEFIGEDSFQVEQNDLPQEND